MTMQEPQKTSDAINLEALQKALAQFNTPLPEPLQQINQQLNQVLANPEPQAIENLLKSALDYEPLSQLFFPIHKELFDEYQAKPKDKGYPPAKKETPPTTTPNLLNNTVAPPPTSATSSPEVPGQPPTTKQGQQS